MRKILLSSTHKKNKISVRDRACAYFCNPNSKKWVGLVVFLKMAQQYTEKKGSYTKKELSLLAASLGFPGSLLADRFPSQFTEIDGAEHRRGRVSEKMIVRLLGSGALFKKLEKVFNRHAAWYNVNSIRKAMQHIRHRSLSFRDISNTRVAFELYSEEDGSGMAAELAQIELALKMVDRICSPSKLQLEIHRFADVSDVPSRLQLYEFMDIVAVCGRTRDEDERMVSELSLSGTVSGEGSKQDLSVADFDQILMTRDEKVRAYLEQDYRSNLHGKKKSSELDHTPTTPALTKDHIVHTDSRKSLVSLGAMQSRAITPCLEVSQSQLHTSRGGFYSLSSECSALSMPVSPRTKSRGYHLQSHTPHAQLHTQQPTSKSHNLTPISRSRSRMSKDPLQQPHFRDQLLQHSQTPVKVRLQQKPAKQTQSRLTATKNDFSSTSVGETLEEDISDICADSVVKAREMLHSSLSVISQSHYALSPTTDPSAVGIHHTSSAEVDSSRRVRPTSRRARQGFLLEPIVTVNEREQQQFLIDGLLWSSRRHKQTYQIIE